MKHSVFASVAVAGAMLLGLAAAAPVSAATSAGGQYKPPAHCVPGRPGCPVPPRPNRPPSIYFNFWYGPYPPPYYYYQNDPYWIHLSMSCSSARKILQRHGYRKLKTLDCEGRYYEFTGYKGGHKFRIRLNAYTGRYTWYTLK
jgi:hypothetical protein